MSKNTTTVLLIISIFLALFFPVAGVVFGSLAVMGGIFSNKEGNQLPMSWFFTVVLLSLNVIHPVFPSLVEDGVEVDD